MRPLTRKRTVRARRRLAAALAALAILGLAIGGIAAFADGGSGDPDFELTVTPETQTVYLGTQTRYGIRISRLNGFTGPVRLHATGLPTGTTATWRISGGIESDVVPPDVRWARLAIRTSWTTPIGSRAVTIGGSAYRRSDGTTIKHSVPVTLAVQRLFKIAGRLTRPLYPGVRVPMGLTLSNPNDFDVSVTRVAVQVSGTDRTGCAADEFRIAQMPLDVYPIDLQPGESRTLRDLGLSSAEMPRIVMVDSTQNQDACKGAKLALSYRGRGTR